MHGPAMRDADCMTPCADRPCVVGAMAIAGHHPLRVSERCQVGRSCCLRSSEASGVWTPCVVLTCVVGSGRVRMPANPNGKGVILGEGKPENQNSAIIYCFNEALQTIDMNQVGAERWRPLSRRSYSCFHNQMIIGAQIREPRAPCSGCAVQACGMKLGAVRVTGSLPSWQPLCGGAYASRG